MEKSLRKRIDEFIVFLEGVNESELEDSTDGLLVDVCTSTTSINKRDVVEYCNFCKMELLTPSRRIIDEVQEILEEKGFQIEIDKCNWYSQDPYFVRTEKGLLTF